MKKLVLAVMAALSLVALVGCSSQPKDKTMDVVLDVNAVASEIMSAGGMTEQNQVDAAALELDESKVKSFAAYQDSEDGTNRVYLFELASADDVNDIKHIGEKEQDDNINRLVSAGDDADALEVAKASRVIVQGNYVLYLSVPNFEEAKAVFTGKFE